MSKMKEISGKTIERLALYRRLLSGLREKGLVHLYSHQLAEFTQTTAVQVRRDIMMTGYTANARKGYELEALIKKIDETISIPVKQNIALIGVGNLGRAILSYFNSQHSALRIVGAFDNDPAKVARTISGCPCFKINEISNKIKELNITLAIITVPGRDAQGVTEIIAHAGIKGILNFAPVPLKLPNTIYCERIDITTAIEKVAYFANKIKI